MNYRAMKYVAEECTVQKAGRAILWVIAYHADKHTGVCTASQRTIAREAGVQRSTMELWLNKLFEDGELAIVMEATPTTARHYQIVGMDRGKDEKHADSEAHAGPAIGPPPGPAIGPPPAPELDRYRGAPGPIHDAELDRSTGASIGRREELEGKNEGLPAPARADSTANAVGAASADGQAHGGLSDETRWELATLKAELARKRLQEPPARGHLAELRTPRASDAQWTVTRRIGFDAVLVPAQVVRLSTDVTGTILERDPSTRPRPAATVGSRARAPPAAA